MTDPHTGSQWILGDKFDLVYPHVGSIEHLWFKKWKSVCERSIYPFHDGRYEDFAPIFDALMQKGIHDGYTDEYTAEFLPTGERLVQKADVKVEEGDIEAAIGLYRRACTVYRIARAPYIINQMKQTAYEAQKAAYMKAACLLDCPMVDVEIPHTAGNARDEGTKVPLYVRLPSGASKDKPVAAVLIICGLDGHRPDNTARSDEILQRGWACVIADCPGTGDCPADRTDAKAADRLWTSILDWMALQGAFDMKRVIAWGLSAGGYNAVRAAHTHASRLAGAIGQGAGTHHFFSRAWLEKAKHHEYPWNPLRAMLAKFGYAFEEELMENAQKDFSLVESGIVNMPSCRLLLVNGTHDGLMPIEDSMLMMEYGTPKEGRFFTGLAHMGYPPANKSVYPWMEQVMAAVL